MLFSKGENINWINGNDKSTQISTSSKLTFAQINSFKYNNEAKYYEIEIKIEENRALKKFDVIDISFGDIKTYAYCDTKDFIMKCKTKTTEDIDDDIYLLLNKDLGSVEWKNLDKNLKINNLIFIGFSKAFNLNFNNGIWKFKIKSNNILDFSGNKLLDILISEKNGLANCKANDYILECEVIGDNQDKTQLIEFDKCYNGDLQLMNINYTFIPFDINLKLIRSFNLYFDRDIKKWSFEIEAQLTDSNIIIPKNSTFTVDIIRLDNNKNELAFCSQKNELNSNIINLFCYTMDEMENNVLISLNNIKSDYSSITWTETIDKLDIYMKLNLNVGEVKFLTFDSLEKKWSFQMIILYTQEIPKNAKTKIDLIYNNEESTATCTYENIYPYKFLCTPDNLIQKEEDVFSISTIQKKGTVKYLNDENILIFKKFGKLTFEKAYDLKFDNNKWKFKIKLSESNLKIHDSITIDIYHKYYQSNAYCIMEENNLLSCESLYYYQSYSDFLKLRYDENSETVEWKNLKNEENIYINYNIEFINVYGGYESGKWKFNLKYEFIEDKTLMNYNDRYALLDILVNGKESTAKCYISLAIFNFLKCECIHENQNVNDVIKLVGNKNPNLGTIYFSYSLNDNQKIIKPFSLSIKDFSIYSHRSSFLDILDITIHGYLSKELNSAMNENSITEFEVLITKLNKKVIKSRVVCYTFSEFLFPERNTNVRLYCHVDEEVLENEVVTINKDSNGYSKYIQFDDFDENNNRINKNIFIHYDKENWERGDTLYEYDKNEEKGNSYELNNSRIIMNKLIYLLIIYGFIF